MKNQVSCFKLAVVIGFALQPVSAFNDQDLRPAGAFDIAKALPSHFELKSFQIHKFIARGGALHFVLSPGPAAEDCVYLTTDLYGGYKGAFRLAPGVVRDADVDDEGRVYVLFGHPEDRTVVYGQNGDGLHESPAPGAMKLHLMREAGLFYLYFDGRLTLESGKKHSRAVGQFTRPEIGDSAPAPLFRFLLSKNSKLLRLERITATMEVCDLLTGAYYSAPIVSPEIEAARRYYQKTVTDPRLRGVIVMEAATGDDGALYLMISGYEDDRGVPVLRVDNHGKVSTNFRGALRPQGSIGKFLPADIGVTSGQLFITSASGTVAVYNIEKD